MRLVLASSGADAGVIGAAMATRLGNSSDALSAASSSSSGAALFAASSPAEAAPGLRSAHNTARNTSRNTIRKARALEDRDATFKLCLETGNQGGDATHLYVSDPGALGKRWVGPYLALEPDFSFVLTDADGRVVGYCLGARDTTAFAARLGTEYLPPLRAAHPQTPAAWLSSRAMLSPEQRVYNELHETSAGAPPSGLDCAAYPSHLHIDLERSARGSGDGTR